MPETNGTATVQQQLEAEIALAGGPKRADPEDAGSVGVTMFDLPGSADLTLTVLLGRDQVQAALRSHWCESAAARTGGSSSAWSPRGRSPNPTVCVRTRTS